MHRLYNDAKRWWMASVAVTHDKATNENNNVKMFATVRMPCMHAYHTTDHPNGSKEESNVQRSEEEEEKNGN